MSYAFKIGDSVFNRTLVIFDTYQFSANSDAPVTARCLGGHDRRKTWACSVKYVYRTFPGISSSQATGRPIHTPNASSCGMKVRRWIGTGWPVLDFGARSVLKISPRKVRRSDASFSTGEIVLLGDSGSVFVSADIGSAALRP